jgi:enoyl-CoA hydratase/carnithine racemase
MALVEREDHGRVAVLTLNRPEQRNALSRGLMDALANELGQVAGDERVGAAVLTGAGACFCAGGDLKEGLGASDGFLASHQARGRFAELLSSIRTLQVPVVAAVNGDAMGGGLGLVSACDLVVADEGARLGTPEIKIGLFPHIILAALQRDVPRKHLMEMVLTGRPISAARGERLGLVNQVAAKGNAVAAAMALAAEIAAKSPAIVAMGKAGFHHIADLDFDKALAHMHGQLTLNLLTEDAMVGIQAFLSRSEPAWKGR